MSFADRCTDTNLNLVRERDADQRLALPPRTLSSRLILFFFATAFALVLASSTILYWATVQALQYADDQVVEKRMLAVAEHLRANELNEGMVGHEVEEDNQGPRQIFIRVVSSYAPLALEFARYELRTAVLTFP